MDMLSEINQTITVCYHLYVQSKNETNEYNKKEADI